MLKFFGILTLLAAVTFAVPVEDTSSLPATQALEQPTPDIIRPPQLDPPTPSGDDLETDEQPPGPSVIEGKQDDDLKSSETFGFGYYGGYPRYGWGRRYGYGGYGWGRPYGGYYGWGRPSWYW